MEAYKRFMGIDYGISKYGLCIGSKFHIHPIEMVKARKGIVEGHVIDKIVKAYDVRCIVIGWPLDIKGNAPKLGMYIADLSNYLQGRYPYCEVHLMNEIYSTQEALRIRSPLKEPVDSLAACVILRDYFYSFSSNSMQGSTFEWHNS